MQSLTSGSPPAVELSRGTMRNIRHNLFFAFVYNAIGIPDAAGMLYRSPAGSSLPF